MARAVNRPHLISAAAVLASGASPALAQEDFQQWLSNSIRAEVFDRFAVQNEIFFRFGDSRDGLYEIENSLLLGYKLSKDAVVWAGYVHNPNYSSGDFAAVERRAREQLTVDNFARIGPAAVSGRLRFEQRWRDGVDGVGSRVRPYVKFTLPLGGKQAPLLNLTAEPFINLTTTAFQSTSGLERLRSAASLSFPLSKSVKLESGYLNQRRFVAAGADTVDHTLTVALGLVL